MQANLSQERHDLFSPTVVPEICMKKYEVVCTTDSVVDKKLLFLEENFHERLFVEEVTLYGDDELCEYK